MGPVGRVGWVITVSFEWYWIPKLEERGWQ